LDKFDVEIRFRRARFRFVEKKRSAINGSDFEATFCEFDGMTPRPSTEIKRRAALNASQSNCLFYLFRRYLESLFRKYYRVSFNPE